MYYSKILFKLFSFILICFFAASCSDEMDNDASGIQDTLNQEQNALHLFAGNRSTDPESDDSEGMDSLEIECFTFVFPVKVKFPDGSEEEVTSEEQLENLIDTWFEQNPESEEEPSLVFPVSIIQDGTTTEIATEEALCTIIEGCEVYEEDDEGEEDHTEEDDPEENDVEDDNEENDEDEDTEDDEDDDDDGN